MESSELRTVLNNLRYVTERNHMLLTDLDKRFKEIERLILEDEDDTELKGDNLNGGESPKSRIKLTD